MTNRKPIMRLSVCLKILLMMPEVIFIILFIKCFTSQYTDVHMYGVQLVITLGMEYIKCISYIVWKCLKLLFSLLCILMDSTSFIDLYNGKLKSQNSKFIL